MMPILESLAVESSTREQEPRPPERPKALISTIEPIDGGVPTMTLCMARILAELGIEPVFAWYEPWSRQPALSVPLHGLPRGRRPGLVRRAVYEGHQGHGLGAWLPELEFTHYLPRRHWRSLIADCRFHISVTGNPLCAAPYARLGLPFLAWVATPWEADRSQRVLGFSLPRRLLDRGLNGPVLRRLERQILRAPGGRILALSSYTSRALQTIAGRPMDGVLLMPVDPSIFFPAPERLQPWKVGFAGRYADPRKNIELLLDAVQILVAAGRPVQLDLVGEMDTAVLEERLHQRGLAEVTSCLPTLSRHELAPVLQGFDVFVIPSYQEGLCIAALEAMACGVPVISTRCGGPEDYVQPGINGDLVDSDPASMAAAISSMCLDRAHRQACGAAAAAWIEANASFSAASRIVREQLAAMDPTFFSASGAA
jgi:glycosyltransferase involved in cell wall biosynthesis